VADLVYPPVIALAKTAFAGLGLRITVTGAEHIPTTGGAVLASSHVSYLDFLFAGFAALPSKRYVRFMAKDQVFRHRVSAPLMRGMHHIPVDRAAGAAAYGAALRALRSGELVGVFPEATISRSFTVKELKSGAARMAQAADVPLIPVVLWGGQRLLTKGLPRDFSRGKAISIAVAEPLHPDASDDAGKVTDELRRRMTALLEQVQQGYPDEPKGEDDRRWLPAHLGGTAPTPQEAAALDAAEAAKRHRAG